MLRIERWGEHDYASVGEHVTWPVEIRCFTRKNGGVAYALSYADGENGFGETF